jgi:hypothetical protein
MPRISRVAWVAWEGGSFLSPQIFCSLSLSSLACPNLAGWCGRAVEQGRATGLHLLEHLHVGQAVEQDVDDGGPLLRSTLMAVLPSARPPRRPLRRATSKVTPSYARPRQRIEDGHISGGSTFSTASRRRLAHPRVLSRVERRAPRRRRLKVSVPLRARPRCPPRHLSFRVRNTTRWHDRCG